LNLSIEQVFTRHHRAKQQFCRLFDLHTEQRAPREC
jgi:hypothetical protein